MNGARLHRRQFLYAGFAGLLALTLTPRAFGNMPPVRVGLDAEFLDPTSTACDAIEFGARRAIDDINARGGVLGGRPLQLVTTDNRSVPSRGVANAERLAAMADLTAYLCGKFSPVALEQLPHIHRLQLPLLNPWSAADTIIDNHQSPNYAFRLGLCDSIAMERLLLEIKNRKLQEVGLLVPSTAWGRSCRFFVERYIAMEASTKLTLTGVEWHRWGNDKTIEESYRTLVGRGAQAILLVANEPEGSALVRGLAGLTESSHRPIFSHWGLTGGRFTEMCGPALHHIELTIAQSFSFALAKGAVAARVANAAAEHFGVKDPLAVPSMTGIGPAYDLVQLLALAIDKAGSTHRPDIQRALEHLPPHDGLVKPFPQAFTPMRHEALDRRDVLVCQFDYRGRLVPKKKS